MIITFFNDWGKINRIVFLASKLYEIHISVSTGEPLLEHRHTHLGTEGCSGVGRGSRDGAQQSLKDPLSKA